jgi:pimeloyl-ACP methyl ester carboxylesterase
MPTLTANGIQIFYELTGPPGAPVLALNNGIIMNAAGSWGFQVAALSRRFRLLRYDCRGQGQSDHPEGPYSMALHAADLAALLDSLEIPRLHLAGISYGGEVVQAFALAYPERCLSLVLADTVSEVGPELRLVIQSWMDAAARGDAGAFFNATVPWNFSPAFIAASSALLADARRRYDLLDYPAVLRLCQAFLEVDFTARLPEITAPACILVGELDLLKGPAYARILQAGLPQSELHLLPGAGHATCWERPNEFNSIVLGFLSRVEG